MMPLKSRKSPNLRVFANRLGKLEDGVPRLGGQLAKAVANRVHERLVMATPVDTSAALSNWQIATAATGPVQTPVPAFYLGVGGSTAMASTAAVLAAAMIPLKTAPPGYPIVISNVIHYILDLATAPYNSPQATGDWVGQAISQGLRQGVTEVHQKGTWYYV